VGVEVGEAVAGAVGELEGGVLSVEVGEAVGASVSVGVAVGGTVASGLVGVAAGGGRGSQEGKGSGEGVSFRQERIVFDEGGCYGVSKDLCNEI
jgi:hypothetical protein